METDRIVLRPWCENDASGRVMEKCGFIPTGETVVDLDQGRDTPIRV